MPDNGSCYDNECPFMYDLLTITITITDKTFRPKKLCYRNSETFA